MKQQNRLSTAQEEEFDGFMQKWQRLLNLGDWRIERAKTKTTTRMAKVWIYYEDRLASFATGDFGSMAITAQSLESTAAHECLHILVAELTNTANTEATADVQMAAEHRVVVTLEKLLCDLIAQRG